MADSLEGIEVPELPEGFVPLEVIAVVKCLDASGTPAISLRCSDGLMSWEALGMVTAAEDILRADLQADFSGSFVPDEEDDEED